MQHEKYTDRNLKKYVIFWFSQAVSQLGSSMTGLSLILWAYTRTGSEMAVSLMTFFNYVPFIIVSLFAGTFVDSHSKKKVMLVSDSAAAVCTMFVFILWTSGKLQIPHIYAVNSIIGFMNAFQQPAAAVAVGNMVPQKELARVSGLNSFSGNLIAVCAPVLAAAFYAMGGLKVILAIDFCSFLFAFSVLLFAIRIPEMKRKKAENVSVFAGCKTGFAFLFQHKGLWYVIVTMAVMNFLSRLTYENILSPMILARSGNSSFVYGIVNACIGIGGIAGGIIVSTGKLPRDRIKIIYVSAALSFLMGDLVMGLGRNVFFWSIAGIAASMPIPFLMAAQNVILYENIPQEIQGRIFAVRNALQFGSIPVGILLGGYLAQYVFEPFMQTDRAPVRLLQKLVGTGKGSGMAVMFLCTGILGSLFSFAISRRKEMNALRFGKTPPENKLSGTTATGE